MSMRIKGSAKLTGLPFFRVLHGDFRDLGSIRKVMLPLWTSCLLYWAQLRLRDTRNSCFFLAWKEEEFLFFAQKTQDKEPTISERDSGLFAVHGISFLTVYREDLFNNARNDALYAKIVEETKESYDLNYDPPPASITAFNVEGVIEILNHAGAYIYKISKSVVMNDHHQKIVVLEALFGRR